MRDSKDGKSYEDLTLEGKAPRELIKVIARAMESCCECGEDYPREELLAGEIYCKKCRDADKRRIEAVKAFRTLDSGKRESFTTGAVRDTQEDKPRYDLIPVGPLERLAGLYARGAVKYEDWNWSKGIPLSRTYASLERHLKAWRKGQVDEDHGAAVLWNMMTLMWTEEEVKAGRLPSALNDLPFRGGVYAQ